MNGKAWAGAICIAVILPVAVVLSVSDFSSGQFPARPLAIIVLVVVGVALWLRRKADGGDA